MLSTFKGWKRREIFPWEAWNPEIASAGGKLSPMLLVDAEIEDRSTWQLTHDIKCLPCGQGNDTLVYGLRRHHALTVSSRSVAT